MPTTARGGLPYPAGSDAPNINQALQDLAAAADAIYAMYAQGTLANRPVSTPGSPGKAGRFYQVTSGAEEGDLYYDYGTGWYFVNPDQTPADGSITLAKMAANSVDASKIVDGSVGAAEIADGSITATEIANALKPSAGAGAGTEALRSLGTSPGQAAPGLHSAQHALAGADPLPTDSVAAAQIQAGAVGSSELAAGAALANLATDSIDGTKIAADAIGASELADNAVAGANVIAGHGGADDYGTVLPSSGLFNGYRFAFFTGGAYGQVWDLIYRSDLDGTYPWHVIGGGDLYAYESGSQSPTGPIWDSTNTPSLSIPRLGIYVVTFGAVSQLTGRGANNVVDTGATYIGLSINGGAPAAVDQLEMEVGQHDTNPHHMKATTCAERVRTLTTGGYLQVWGYGGQNDDTVMHDRRFVSAKPLKIG